VDKVRGSAFQAPQKPSISFYNGKKRSQNFFIFPSGNQREKRDPAFVCEEKESGWRRSKTASQGGEKREKEVVKASTLRFEKRRIANLRGLEAKKEPRIVSPSRGEGELARPSDASMGEDDYRLPRKIF